MSNSVPLPPLKAKVGLAETQLDELLTYLRDKRVVRKFGDEDRLQAESAGPLRCARGCFKARSRAADFREEVNHCPPCRSGQGGTDGE